MSESVAESAPAASESPSSEAEVSSNDYVEAETLPLFDEHTDNLHTVKVNGVEKQVPYDKVIEGFQKGEAADEKFREASKKEKEYSALRSENQTLQKNYDTLQANVNALIAQLKNDPMGLIGHKSLGHNVNELIESAYQKQLDYEELDETERENHELKKRLQNFEAQEEQKRRQQFEAERVAGQNQYKASIKEKLAEAGISPTENNVRIAGMHLRNSCNNNGNVTITWRQMADQTKETLKHEARENYGKLTPEQFSEFFGEDMIKNIRQHDLKKVKNNFNLNQPSSDIVPINPANRKQNWISKDDYRAKMDRIKRQF
tara:strand:+ start:4381 stop:5331 length:951 start_codon:yes stop_codon:yes gene_type:complete